MNQSKCKIELEPVMTFEYEKIPEDYIEICDYCWKPREHQTSGKYTCTLSFHSERSKEKRNICVDCLIKAFDKLLKCDYKK